MESSANYIWCPQLLHRAKAKRVASDLAGKAVNKTMQLCFLSV